MQPARQNSHASPESGRLKFACKFTLSFLFSLVRPRHMSELSEVLASPVVLSYATCAIIRVGPFPTHAAAAMT